MTTPMDTDSEYIKPTRVRKSKPRRADGGEDFRNVPGSRPHVLKNKKARKTEKQNWKRFEGIE